MAGVLVGVDGSESSRRALAWALREALLRHVPLTVMSVRPGPARPASMSFWGLRTLPEGGLDQDQARQSVQDFVAKAAGEAGGAVPDIVVSLAEGEPAEELITASRDADLLVVGSRGSGGFSRLLMGSVSSQVTHHAACPVVVVPAAGRAT